MIADSSIANLALRVAAQGANNENWVDDLTAECRKKQDLLVLGIPFDCSAAQIMAAADYTLKAVANSDLPVRVAGFESLAAKRRRVAAQELDRGNFTQTESMSRLWFYPGQVTYREQPGAIALDCVEIIAAPGQGSRRAHAQLSC